MKHYILLIAILVLTTDVLTQVEFNSEGSTFLHGGYIRTGYSEGSVQFISDQYDIEVSGVLFSDSDRKTSAKDFFNFASITNIQYSIQGGYFFRDFFAVTLGFSNHLIYMDQNEGLFLSGTLEKFSHPTYNGTEYYNFVINPTIEQLHYRQPNGVKFIRFGALTSHQIPIETREKYFTLMVNAGLELGPLISGKSEYYFGNEVYRGKTSISGVGFSSHGSLRAIFLKHVYLQAGLNGGYFSNFNIKLNNSGSLSAKHNYPYLSPELSAGVTIQF